MEDKFKTNKPLYNHDMEFEISNLPKYIIDAIHELEELDRQGDWFNYDIKFDELENQSKTYIINGKLSDSDYKKILEKYGGLYD